MKSERSVIMLVAVDQHGKAISLVKRPPEALISELRSSRHFCPVCRQPVILKAGAVKVPHFAHMQAHSCDSFTERESDRHLKGKVDLYSWISRYEKVKLEAFLPDISQRPDLLAEGKVAVEYQCSHISANLFVKRTAGYKANGVFPLWIYGGPPIKKQAHLYRFSAFHRLFFQYSPLFGFWFLMYCPEREAFLLYSQLTPISASLYSASVQIIPLTYLPYPPSFAKKQPPTLFSLSQWFKQKNQWIQKQLYFKQGVYHPFLSLVYKTGHNPFLLPEWIGVPVRYMALIKNHPIEWQFYLWKDLLSRKKEAGVQEAVNVIEEYVAKGNLQMNIFPLVSSLTVTDLTKEYLFLLQSADVKSLQASKTTFEQMAKEKRFAADYEELIMNRLIF
ncbi:hypothetical protein F9802_15670 [Bacillus aerolatus]|uniref:Competence protein CoiA n=1 Tax=Bacillus aerolatus TaxID=2653354 RepID=A0A6I1FCI2_9BACI|nr:competence protein CoiA family protein [Bacillus aerolatus]KAB7704998.1 hypothetical protein F9802_15670 [Bacillus aerolatus]